MSEHKIIRSFRGAFRFLSNFYACDVAGWPSVEHAFQAAKTEVTEWRLRIRKAPTASAAKRLGKMVPLRPDWEDIKIDQMRALLRVKFKTEPLRSKLLATGDMALLEGNEWHDNFWGACTCDWCAGKPQENWLGRLLMEIRQGLREGADWTKE